MVTEAGRPGRGRRPAAQLRHDILDSVWELLLAEGVDKVGFDAIAARTPCSKNTLYKWWASPGVLAAEAFFTRSEPALAFPDTGDLDTDLRRQLTSWVDFLARTGAGPALAGLIGAAQSDPELRRAWAEKYSLPRRRLAVDRFETARRAGQIGVGVDAESMVDQLWGACYHRLLIPDQPLDHLFVDAIVTNILRGVSGGAPRSDP